MLHFRHDTVYQRLLHRFISLEHFEFQHFALFPHQLCTLSNFEVCYTEFIIESRYVLFVLSLIRIDQFLQPRYFLVHGIVHVLRRCNFLILKVQHSVSSLCQCEQLLVLQFLASGLELQHPLIFRSFPRFAVDLLLDVVVDQRLEHVSDAGRHVVPVCVLHLVR
jgi:hypothetical protein